MSERLDIVANRRAHLVAGLALAASSFALVVTRALSVETVSKDAPRLCAWLAWATAAIIVGALTKTRPHFVVRAVIACGLAGVFVAVMAHACIANGRPTMQLSFDGEALDPMGIALFGGVIGASFGALVGVFAEVTRPLTSRSPELVCVAAWALAGATAIAARNWIVLAPCALGIVIQLAAVRRQRDVAVRAGPYR